MTLSKQKGKATTNSGALSSMSILASVTIHTIVKIGLLLFCNVGDNLKASGRDTGSEVR
jgi:hypothetical protein